MGCIASRPYILYIYVGTNTYEVDAGYFKEVAYFLDFICVHRELAGKNISRNLIQTHEYNQRTGQNMSSGSPPTLISFFKKEGELCSGIVPVLTYTTFMFQLRKVRISRMPPHITITRIFKENAQLLQDFFDNLPKTREFGIIAVPAISAIIGQIHAQKMFVFVLKYKAESLGYYFFKDPATNFEIEIPESDNPKKPNADSVKEYKTLQFCASLSNIRQPNSTTFYRGFLHSIYEIVRLEPQYKVLVWDNIAHNTQLFQRWTERTPVWISNPTAYYLYNLVSPKRFRGELAFII